MSKDDTLDKDMKRLDEEIDAKVDSLFVETDQSKGQEEEDPWKGLKEQFLTLEWEIDKGVLERILVELGPLKERFSVGTLGELLDWLVNLTEFFILNPDKLDQDSMRLFHDTKDLLLQFIEDPNQEPGPDFDVLKGRVDAFFESEREEVPTITLESDEGVIFEELEKMEAAGEMALEEGSPSTEEIEPETWPDEIDAEEEALEEYKETVVIQEPEELKKEAVEGPEQEAFVEASASEGAAEASAEDIEALKRDLISGGEALQGLLRRMKVAEDDPFGLRRHFRELEGTVEEFSNSLQDTIESLQNTIEAISKIELQKETTPPPQPTGPQTLGVEEVLLFSLGNKVFGVPMKAVKGIFKIPNAAVSQVIQSSHIKLRGRDVEVVPFWRRLGLAIPFYPFSAGDKRILLLDNGGKEVALIVDKALARKSASIEPVEEDPTSMFKGAIVVEKQAMVIDVGSL